MRLKANLLRCACWFRLLSLRGVQGECFRVGVVGCRFGSFWLREVGGVGCLGLVVLLVVRCRVFAKDWHEA